MLPGVVAGIGGYGNSLGLPNIGGEVVFDASYSGNPLVNALCVGVMRVEDLHLAFASGTGNKIILFGARTGLDGIGGVSVLASDTFDGDEAARAARSCRRCRSATRSPRRCSSSAAWSCSTPGLVVGIQDLGGAGLSCATSRARQRGRRRHARRARRGAAAGHRHDPGGDPVQRVPGADVRGGAPENVEAFLAVCRKWDVLATVIGEVTDGDRLVITWHGDTVVDVPPRTVAHDGPVYRRPVRAPTRPGRAGRRPARPAAPPGRADRAARGDPADGRRPNLCSRAWVTDQYDRYVRGNTVLAQPADAGMVRVDEGTGRGVAVATDCNARFAALDPYAGAQLALAEAYRNVATSRRRAVAVTNCLNFGSPEDPHVMWQFSEAVRGLADGCAQLGIPVTGGNVSFYNQTGDRDPARPRWSACSG